MTSMKISSETVNFRHAFVKSLDELLFINIKVIYTYSHERERERDS